MLTKRTHILFDEEMSSMLARLAQQQATSVGSLVRRAVKKTYKDIRLTKRNKRHNAVRALMAWQKKIGTFKHIDYRALIEDGRKY